MTKAYDVLFSMPWATPLLAGTRPAGGAETQILMLSRALAARGMSVALLVRADGSELPREVEGVRVLTQRAAPELRGLGGALHDVFTLVALVRAPARTIVQRNASRSVGVAALAARVRRRRFVYSSANVVDFDLGSVERPWNLRLYEWGVRRAAAVVVQTDEQAGLCRGRFGRDPVVIRSIAEPAEPRRERPEAFLWIGRLVSYKRLDVLLELARRMPEARFQVIAVPGASAPDLEAQLERAHAELPNVEVLPPRTRDELVPLIRRAVAIVNTADFEGMPNVFLEGWARGVPALAFSHDPDGVVAEHGLGEFAHGSLDQLLELAREQWATRSHQQEVAERCIGYVRSHHQLDAVSTAWRSVLEAA